MAQFVKKQDIVAEYSGIVAGFMAVGYRVFTPTMGGSQGEEAHIDLINPEGDKVYRVLLYSECTYGHGLNNGTENISVRVYDAEYFKVPDLAVMYNSSCGRTVWNDKGTELIKRTWYAMAQGNHHTVNHYIDDVKVTEQAYERRKYKCANNLYNHTEHHMAVAVDMDKLVMFIRNHGGRGYGRVTATQIKEVKKYVNYDGKMTYVITFTDSKKSLVYHV
jgi:hypothetical protein